MQKIISFINKILSVGFQYFCPQNPIFVKQVGQFSWRLRLTKMIFYKLIGKKIDILPFGNTSDEARYEIRSWDSSSTEIFLTNGLADWGLERIFLLCTKSDGLLIDVGAHSGYFCNLFYDKCSDFVAIETSHICVEECLLPLKDKWKEKQFHVINSPCFNEPGIDIEVMQTTDGWGRSDGRSNEAHVGGSSEVMKTVSIDSIFSSDKFSNKTVNAIKIDVDGPDMEVLSGASKVIAEHRPVIFIENFTVNLQEFAKENDYVLFTFCADKTRPWQMKFIDVTAITNYDLWTKMTLCVPAEQSNVLCSLAQMEVKRDSRDTEHLFAKI